MIRNIVRVALLLGIVGYGIYRYTRKRRLRRLAKQRFKVLRGGKYTTRLKKKVEIVNG